MAVHKLLISVDRDFERVAAPTVERISQDACLEHVRKLPASELEALIYCILRNFSRWSDGDTPQLDACLALLRNSCFIRSIPLFEAAGLLYTIRDCTLDLHRIDNLRSGIYPEPTSAEENAARFFDLLVFELLKGY